MARPLSLRALFALRRGGPDPGSDPGTWPERPAGPLIWFHADSPAGVAAGLSLLAEFRAEGERATLLLTTPGQIAPAGQAAHVIHLPLPDDRGEGVLRFVTHWRPDILVWAARGLRPRLLDRTSEERMTRILVDPGGDLPLVDPGGPLLPGVTRALLGLFEEGICRDAQSAAILSRSGLSLDRIRILPPLEAAPPVLRHVESDRQEMATALGTRPVWLCVDPQGAEIGHAIAAHREAIRRAHRLLLIIAAEDPDALTPRLSQDGLDVAHRLAGDELSFARDVLLADLSELGLWYRLAPIAFAGGSVEGTPSRDPFEAAALGSVLIHGPVTGPFEDRFRALERGSASLPIARGEDLGAAVVALLSAERTAQFAHSGWDVVTRGAETMTHLVQRLRDALDRAGA